MEISEAIERSKSKENIDFLKIGCTNLKEPLVPITAQTGVIIEPIWGFEQDPEGNYYKEYIQKNPTYDQIYVRQGLLNRLENAVNSLDDKYQLVVRAGHRPLEVQKNVLKAVMSIYKNENPDASTEEALEHARVYVSDPEIKLPPHCCGAAIDVDLFDTHNHKPVDFGCAMNHNSDIAFLHSDIITDAQKNNRMLLLETMLSSGFASYYAEWWHFSYGDQIWAWFYGQKDCLYSLIDF